MSIHPRAGRIGEPVREEPLIVPAPPAHQPVERPPSRSPEPQRTPAPEPARPSEPAPA